MLGITIKAVLVLVYVYLSYATYRAKQWFDASLWLLCLAVTSYTFFNDLAEVTG